MQIHAAKAFELTQYDTTNATEINDIIDAQSRLVSAIVSEVDGVLTLHVAANGGYEMGAQEEDVVINTNDWVGPDPAAWWLIVVPDAEIVDTWIVRDEG